MGIFDKLLTAIGYDAPNGTAHERAIFVSQVKEAIGVGKNLSLENDNLRNRVADIEGKLPKTADGVPVVPGMNVYTNRINNDGTWPDPYAGRLPQQFAVFDGVDWSRLPSQCYSTKEAAEVARKKL